MSERTFNDLGRATEFAKLMKKLCGHEVDIVRRDDGWVVRPFLGRKSIVEVTEALLRQVGK